jgi:hypothetical protein
MNTKRWKSVIGTVGSLALLAAAGAAQAGDWGQAERILTLTADPDAAYFSAPSYTACGNAEGWTQLSWSLANAKQIYSTLLTAYTTGRQVKLYTEGCNGQYAVVTRVQVL